jgi:sporulation protein YlmC with PRC-barrel domain
MEGILTVRLKFTELKGMEVLAEKEGKLLGSVRKLHLDSKRKTAIGVVFKARGLSGERWAKVAKIQRVGEDVLFLSDKKAEREDEPDGRDVRDMLGLPVTSLDGKRLGALDDVIIDTKDWSVAALALDNGGEVDLGKEAVLGEDTILMQIGAHDQVKRGTPAQSGFLARVFNPEEEALPKKKPSKRSKKKTTRKRKR